MKKAVLFGERRAGVIEVPDPVPTGDFVLVKVHAAPLCTEYKAFAAGEKALFLGHEAAGEVVAVAQPGAVVPGDRVVVMPQYPCGQCALCRDGDFIHCEHNLDFHATAGPEGNATVAQYLLKPSWLLPKIPAGMPYERAALACCALGPSCGAFDRMGVDAFGTVLVSGAGPVGLGAVVNARFRGAAVIVVEGAPWRAEVARRMGALAVLDPGRGVVDAVRELTGGRGADWAIECSGTVAGERGCIDAVRRLGKVAFVGECGSELALRVSPDLLRKGLQLFGSWHYNLRAFPRVMAVIAGSPLLDLLVSHVLPMERIAEAMDVQCRQEAAKVILQPWP